MKKHISPLTALCFCIWFLVGSCEKAEDPAMKKVYYASQPGYGGGGNPNPNGVSGSGSTTTSPGTGTTTPTCVSAMSVNSVPCSAVSASGGVVSGTYRLIHSGSCIQVQITFPTGSAPAAGTYQIVAAGPVGNQCTFMDVTNTATASGGSVFVNTSSGNKVTYANVSVGALSVGGTACY